MRPARLFTLAGGIFAFLAVAAGAFGAHALRATLSASQLATFETAARYQMYHALGLFICGYLAQQGWRLARLAGWLFIAGTVLFSGSLYLIVFTGITRFGAITPFGGVCFLAGWLSLVICAWPRGGTPEFEGHE